MHRVWIGLALVLFAACDGKKEQPKLPDPPKTPSTPPKPEPPAVKGPDRVTVQHILISFEGTGTKATRTKEEALKLAQQVLDKVKRGEDFANLVRQYSDDDPVGIYTMFNEGVQRADPEEFPRNGMARGFGDVAFSLEVGHVGVAEHDEARSPYGWHIIKRIK
jgi:parvulin-like peptidyl-prolyl isomerase